MNKFLESQVAPDYIEDILAELDRIGTGEPSTYEPPPLPMVRSLREWLEIASKQAGANRPQPQSNRGFPTEHRGRCPVRRPHATSLPSSAYSHTACKGKATSLRMAFNALGSHDQGRVFTLNLGSKRQAAIASATDPARAMSQHLRRAFDAVGLPLPELAFSLEVSRLHGRLHVHGVLKLDADPALVKRALMKAGGKVAGRAASRQVDLKPFDWAAGGPGGWHDYLHKAVGFTKRTLGARRLTYISNGLRRLVNTTR